MIQIDSKKYKKNNKKSKNEINTNVKINYNKKSVDSTTMPETSSTQRINIRQCFSR